MVLYIHYSDQDRAHHSIHDSNHAHLRCVCSLSGKQDQVHKLLHMKISRTRVVGRLEDTLFIPHDDLLRIEAQLHVPSLGVYGAPSTVFQEETIWFMRCQLKRSYCAKYLDSLVHIHIYSSQSLLLLYISGQFVGIPDSVHDILSLAGVPDKMDIRNLIHQRVIKFLFGLEPGCQDHRIRLKCGLRKPVID